MQNRKHKQPSLKTRRERIKKNNSYRVISTDHSTIPLSRNGGRQKRSFTPRDTMIYGFVVPKSIFWHTVVIRARRIRSTLNARIITPRTHVLSSRRAASRHLTDTSLCNITVVRSEPGLTVRPLKINKRRNDFILR